jgi:glycosyltransferase involved in cell wall biosynthesis
MATGAPVVATAHGGMPEMILDGVTGLLVPERDPQALADAVARLLDEQGFAETLSRAARDKVATEASRQVLDRRVIAVYRGTGAVL